MGELGEMCRYAGEVVCIGDESVLCPGDCRGDELFLPRYGSCAFLDGHSPAEGNLGGLIDVEIKEFRKPVGTNVLINGGDAGFSRGRNGSARARRG